MNRYSLPYESRDMAPDSNKLNLTMFHDKNVLTGLSELRLKIYKLRIMVFAWRDLFDSGPKNLFSSFRTGQPGVVLEE